MQPEGVLRGDAVHVGGDARQRFYDSRGYGRAIEGNEIALSRVEAAHLLFRGDLSGVRVEGDSRSGGSPVGFERFFVASADAADRFALRYLVYADLRERGFYLSPVRERWPGGDAVRTDGENLPDDVDFAVYERGLGPPSGAVAHQVRVVGEREPIPAAGIAGRTLAIVDEESDLTYFAASTPDMAGGSACDLPAGIPGVLLEDRVVVWDAPERLYELGFYGQPLGERTGDLEGALQLSLLEAASLAADGALAIDERVDDPGWNERSDLDAIAARGRAVEGERFDRRLAVYRDLRQRGMVPKTGFKFGADFRTYPTIETVSDLPHSEHLVRVIEPDHAFAPRELSLDIRLSGGVRKRMVFALTRAASGTDAGSNPDAGAVEYLEVGRITP